MDVDEVGKDGAPELMCCSTLGLCRLPPSDLEVVDGLMLERPRCWTGMGIDSSTLLARLVLIVSDLVPLDEGVEEGIDPFLIQVLLLSLSSRPEEDEEDTTEGGENIGVILV